MKKAFTLIELLVVIAIIAILAAILFPVFAQAKAAAKASANLSNLKQNGLGLIQYSADSDDVFPLAVRIETTASQQQAFNLLPVVNPATAIPAIPWTEAVFPYTKNRDIYVSPLESTVSGNGMERAWRQAQYYGGMPTAQAINTARAVNNTVYQMPGGYGANAFVDGTLGYANANNNTVAPSKSQTAVDHVSDVVLLSDAGMYDMGLLNPTTAPAVTNGALCFTGASYAPSAWTTVYAGPWGRKNVQGTWNGGKACNYVVGQQGQTTYVAVDGSAKSMATSKVYEKRSIDGTANNVAVYRLYSGTTQ